MILANKLKTIFASLLVVACLPAISFAEDAENIYYLKYPFSAQNDSKQIVKSISETCAPLKKSFPKYKNLAEFKTGQHCEVGDVSEEGETLKCTDTDKSESVFITYQNIKQCQEQQPLLIRFFGDNSYAKAVANVKPDSEWYSMTLTTSPLPGLTNCTKSSEAEIAAKQKDPKCKFAENDPNPLMKQYDCGDAQTHFVKSKELCEVTRKMVLDYVKDEIQKEKDAKLKK